MRHSSISTLKSILSFTAFLFIATTANSQGGLDWKTDTLSSNAAKGGKDSYLNTIRGSGQKATERINLPVNKLKAVMDACASKGISEISASIVVIRPEDVARYRKNHPESTATDAQIKGSQLIVFRVPRRAFAGEMGARIKLSNHPLMTSLAAMGLVQVQLKYSDLGFGSADDVYLEFGTICPPPTVCD